MKTQTKVAFVALLFFVGGAGFFLGGSNDNPRTLQYNWDNTRCLTFYDIDPFVEKLDAKQTWKQMDEWKLATNIAISLLPEYLVKDMCLFDRKIGIIFWVDSEDWRTGVATEDGNIFLNLTPKNNSEVVSWNERPLKLEEVPTSNISIMLHEIGHVYETIQRYHVFEELYDGDNLKANSEQVPTKYAQAMANKDEDFADSFELYILWPRYLKQHFPQRYSMVRKLMKTEFPGSGFQMPEYLEDRLTVR